VGSITISAIAGDEGKLFGSVGARELEEAIAAAGSDVSKNEISLPEGPLRQVGEFNIDVHLHTDITETITVVIEAE
jgi:large subunit ribosomal protein L9